MSVKNRLNSLLKELNLKIVDFSKKTKIPYRTLQNYLSGQRQASVENLQKIAIQFNVSINWLLTGKGEMFMSDIDNDNIGMPIEFINKLREDLKDKGDDFYASLSMSKDRILDVLLGRTKLRRVEVIELARKLNKSLDDYMYLADYVPKEFVRVLKNPKMMESLRTAGQLTDQEIDQAITAFTNVLKEFAKKHNLK